MMIVANGTEVKMEGSFKDELIADFGGIISGFYYIAKRELGETKAVACVCACIKTAIDNYDNLVKVKEENRGMEKENPGQ